MLSTCITVGLAGAAAFSPASALGASRVVSRGAGVRMETATGVKPVVVGVAADSGCGKSTFMCRMTSIFGGESKLNDIGRETNTLVSDMTTVICLDDYHKWDRTGRKSNPEWPDGITALHADCQKWDKMAEDVTNLKSGTAVDKPIYNHITGELDPDEHVEPTPIVIFEGLHPMYDERVNKALDLTIYLDITDEVKAAIDGRKPDFAAYVEPQKEKADIVIQVLFSDIVDDKTGKYLKVKYIQKKSVTCVAQPYLFDEGSTIKWTPNAAKLSSSEGVAFASYDDEWFGQPVSVIEMDGSV